MIYELFCSPFHTQIQLAHIHMCPQSVCLFSVITCKSALSYEYIRTCSHTTYTDLFSSVRMAFSKEVNSCVYRSFSMYVYIYVCIHSLHINVYMCSYLQSLHSCINLYV